MMEEKDTITTIENGTVTSRPSNRHFHESLPKMDILISSNDKFDNEKSIRTNLNVPESRTFLISNFLTKEECQFLVEETNKNGYKTIEKEFPSEYRNNTRYIGKNLEASQNWYHRLKKFLVNDDLDGVKPYGFDQQGIWIPLGLSNCFLFSKYDSGGKFKPHYDSTYVKNPDNRSIYTVQIYLNDDFEGGQTKFYKKTSEYNPMDQNSTNNLQLLETINPKTGTALIFNHDVLHEGGEVLKGTKYIVRIYMMFLRVDNSFDPWESQKLDLEKVTKLFYEADSAEKDSKDTTLAIQLYVSAQMVLLKYPSIPSKEVIGKTDLNHLPELLLFEIINYLSIHDIGKLLILNKYFNDIVKKNVLWKKIFIRNFSYESYQIEETNFMLEFLKTNSMDQMSKETGINWYLTSKTIHASRKKKFLTFDFGSELVKFCDETGLLKSVPQRASKYKHYSPHHVISSFDKVRWVIGLNLPLQYYTCVANGEVIPECNELMYEMMRYCANRSFIPRKTLYLPIQLSISPKVYNKPNFKLILSNCNEYNLPIYFLNSGLLALQSHGLTSGTVVMFGTGHTIIVPFLKGDQLDRISEFPINGTKLKEYIYSKENLHSNDNCPIFKKDKRILKKKWYQSMKVVNSDYKLEVASSQSKLIDYSPEMYFNPSVFSEVSHTSKIGISEHTHKFILSFKPKLEDVQTETSISIEDYLSLQNVVVTGGISVINNFTERFARELKELDPTLNVIFSNDRFNDVIKGSLININLSKSSHDKYQAK